MSMLEPFLLYLDPGSGSLIFSTIFGAATAGYFALKGGFYAVRSFFHRKGGIRAGDDTSYDAARIGDLVLFNEGAQYRSSFEPLLDEFERRGIAVTYLTLDREDPLLDRASDATTCMWLGPEAVAFSRMKRLTTKVCGMTTPGLDVLQLRRSPSVDHYAYLIHSPTDKSFNRTYSFDYFDSVIVCGEHQRRVLRTLEDLRGTTPKRLPLAGCLYFDRTKDAYEKALARAEPRGDGPLRVLVAPTWGRNGLLSRYGANLLRPLLAEGHRLTIRPHPQSLKSEIEMIERLREEMGAQERCDWDIGSNGMDAFAGADILLSDISGVVFDFAFLTSQPVVTVDFPVDMRGFDANDLPFTPWDIDVLDTVGRRVGEGELDDLAGVLAEEASDTARRDRIEALRRSCLVNFGAAAAPTVNVLLKLRDNPHAFAKDDPLELEESIAPSKILAQQA